MCCGVVLCFVVSFCLVFFGAVLGWSWALKEGQKVRKNEPWEMLLGAKIYKKTMKNQSWRALGGLWGALGGQEGGLRLKKDTVRSRIAT